MKNILVAQDLQPMLQDAVRLLNRPDIVVRTAASGEEILKFHLEKNASMIVTHPALPGMACKTVVDVLRRGQTLKKVSILLLCENDPQQLEMARSCNVNAVLTLPVDTARLADKVRQLLDVPPRQEYNVVLNVSAEGLHENKPFLCRLENISTSGILIRTEAKLGVGNAVACSFFLPDGLRVATGGVVIRSFKKDASANVVHYGISFQQLSPDAAKAIRSFVDRASNRRPGNPGAK
jgi:CheY-like chemotaxis protein